MQPTRIRLAAPAALLAALACHRAPILEAHAPGSPISGLQRLGGDGPYVAGRTERFRALTSGAGTVAFAASAGTLAPEGDEVSWQLPDADAADLTVTLQGATGPAATQTFHFALARGAALSAATAGAVDPSSDDTGQRCRLAFDGSGNPHIAYFNATHPSLWWAAWTGSSWSRQQVDGMGFEAGGPVYNGELGFAVASDGTPHFAYALNLGQGQLMYATRSGQSWQRELIDPASVNPYALALALDGAQGGRPTVAYTGFNGGTKLGYRAVPGSWTVQQVTVPPAPNSCTPYFSGGFAMSGGTAFFTSTEGCNDLNYVSAWTTGAAPSSTVVFGRRYGSSYERLAMDGPRPVAMVGGDVFHVMPGASLADATVIDSPVETFGPQAYDVGWSPLGKPVVALLHGASIEIISPDANGYWVYTQVATSNSSTPLSLAFDAAGAPHVCFRNGSKIFYQ
jgi:hypothetical protein